MTRLRTEAIVDDVGGDRFVDAGGGDEVVGSGAFYLMKLDRLSSLELDDLDGVLVVGVAGDEYGDIVATLKGEREHVDGEHDIDALFDLSAVG